MHRIWYLSTIGACGPHAPSIGTHGRLRLKQRGLASAYARERGPTGTGVIYIDISSLEVRDGPPVVSPIFPGRDSGSALSRCTTTARGRVPWRGRVFGFVAAEDGVDPIRSDVLFARARRKGEPFADATTLKLGSAGRRLPGDESRVEFGEA